MNRFRRVLAKWPTEKALRLAVVLGLIALPLMCLGVLDPRPLQVVISMSVSHVFGGLAFLLFVLSIAADLARAGVLTRDGGPGAS